MSSASKTLKLLSYFSATRPEIGLSQLCRLAKRDKATTHRHLQALEETGFVEQNPLTKRYRLGPVVLHLAQIREQTVPRKLAAETALSALANATGETAHVSVLSGNTVYPLAHVESSAHSTRAIIDLQTFPLHATASGLCTLAFGPAALLDVAKANMPVFTPMTLGTTDDLAQCVQSIQQTGFARSNGGFESDVRGLATPIFDHTGQFAGAVSVASVATRFSADLQQRIQQNLMIASRDISRDWGGTLPEHIENLWANSLTHAKALETAS